MEIVLLTALGVGSATVFGAVLGFVFKKISHKFILSCEIMLSLGLFTLMIKCVNIYS